MNAGEKPVAPFILSLLGGILILLGAFMMSMFAFVTGNMMGMTGMMSGTMGGFSGVMAMMMMMGYSFAFTIVGLASGALVILGAVMLYSRPFEKDLWGAVIIAFSILSMLGGMGGYMIGLVLGIVGGVLALAWNPTPKTALSTPTILSS